MKLCSVKSGRWHMIMTMLAITLWASWNGRGAVRVATNGENEENSGTLATLYALDPLTQTFCFEDGKAGHVLNGNLVYNRCSDLDFNNYRANSFSTGIEGGRLGVIVDLGNSETLKSKYHYLETVGDGQGFFSLRAQAGKIVILKDLKTHDVQELSENATVFSKGQSNASAPVKLGHIYLVRITDRYKEKFERLVKFMVVAYIPDQSVTIRWQLL